MTGGAGTPVGTGGSTPDVVRIVDRTGSSTQGSGSGDFGGDGFIAPTNTADANGNSLPDAWEQQYSQNGTLDPNADADGDGLTNFDEFKLRTNPMSRITDGQLDADVDTDGDGVPNLDEIALGGEPWLPDTNGDGILDGQTDTDGDGTNDADEVSAGTDPTTVEAPPTDPAPVAPPVDNPNQPDASADGRRRLRPGRHAA